MFPVIVRNVQVFSESLSFLNVTIYETEGDA